MSPPPSTPPERCPTCGAVTAVGAGCPRCFFAGLDDETVDAGVLREEGLLGEKYRLIEKLGEGGFAIVWRAEQVRPVRREVAVKLLKDEVASPQVLARFEGERTALARMDHPGIAMVLDAGEVHGQPYFVVELVRGEPITRHCERNELTVADRARLFAALCDAVQHAHGKGVVHRDLKPANILVPATNGTGDSTASGAPRVKVIDFGVARALEEPLATGAATGWRQIIGTPGYMAPEQEHPALADVDVRADVYALGVVLYELMAGRLPFRSELHARQPADDPPGIGRKGRMAVVPRSWCRDLSAISAKALSWQPEKRYPGAQALADDVRRMLDHQPVTARGQSSFYVLGKLAERHRGAMAGALTAIVCLLAGLASSTTLYFREQQTRQMVEDQAQTLQRTLAQSDRRTAERLKQERQYLLAVPYQCRALALEPDAGGAADLLATLAFSRQVVPEGPPLIFDPAWGHFVAAAMADNAARPAAIFERDEESRIVFWNPAVTGAAAAASILPEGVNRLALAPDGTRAVVLFQNRAPMLVNASGKDATVLSLPDSSVATVAGWEPDGAAWWIGGADGSLWRFSSAETAPRAAGKVPAAVVQMLAVPASRRGGGSPVLLAGTAAGEVWRLPVDGPMPAEPVLRLQGKITALTALDAQLMAAGDEKGGIAFTRRGAGGAPLLAEPMGSRITALAFSEDGTWLAAAEKESALRCLRTVDGVPTRLLQGTGGIAALEWMPDSNELLLVGDDASARLWHAVDFSLSTLRPPQATVFCDMGKGTILAAWDKGDALRVLQLPQRSDLGLQLEPTLRNLAHLSFAADGSVLGRGGRGGVVRWDPQTLKAQPVKGVFPGAWLAADPVGDEWWLTDTAGSLRRESSGALPQTWPAVNGEGGWSLAAVCGARKQAVLARRGERGIACVSWGEPGTAGHSIRVESAPVAAVALSRDGRWVAVGGEDGSVKLLDWAGQPLGGGSRHASRVQTLVFSPDGRRLLSGSLDGTTMLWDVAAGVPKTDLLPFQRPVMHAAFSGDGARAVIAAGLDLAVIDAHSGFTIGPRLLRSGNPSALAMNGDGSQFVAAWNDLVLLWSLPPPVPTVPPWTYEFARQYAAVKFGPAGALEPFRHAGNDALRSLMPPDDRSDAATLAGWLLSRPDSRRVLPWHPLSLPEYESAVSPWPPQRVRPARQQIESLRKR